MTATFDGKTLTVAGEHAMELHGLAELYQFLIGVPHLSFRFGRLVAYATAFRERETEIVPEAATIRYLPDQEPVVRG